MGAPTVTSVDMACGSLGTTHVDVDTWEVLVRCRIADTVLTLPTGRWLCEVVVGSTRGDVAAPTWVGRVDATLASPGTVTVPGGTWLHHRPLTGSAGQIQGYLRVQQRVGSAWMPSQSSPITTVAAVAVAPAAGAKRWGAHLIPLATTGESAVDVRPRLDMLQTAGADTVRTGFQWAVLQPTSASTWDEAEAGKLDTLMADCASRSLAVIAFLGIIAPPAWAGTTGNPDLTKLATFIDEALTRWPGLWGVTGSNEPETFGVTATQFAAAHSVLWTRVQAFNIAQSKTIKVAIGDLAYANVPYLSGILDAGVSGFDAVAHHPYNLRFASSGEVSTDQWRDPAVPWPTGLDSKEESIVDGCYLIDEQLRSRGLTKTQWITEYGFANALRDAPGLNISEPLAGAWLATGMRQAARIPMVEVFCVHVTHNRYDDIRTWVYPFGLATRAGRLKAQHTQFTAVLAEVP